MIEAIYQSLHNDNHEIDSKIAELKAALSAKGLKNVAFDPEKIAQNNRNGRKTLQSYFKKRGVIVEFTINGNHNP